MEKFLTKYFWVLNLITLALAAYLLADGTGELVAAELSGLMPDQDSGKAGATLPVKKTADSWTAPDGTVIFQRNIFDSATGPLERDNSEPDLPPEAEAPSVLNGTLPLVPCSGIGVTLLATIASRYDPEWSFASISEGNTARLCRVGDPVSGRTVTGITWRFLFLRGATDECYLDLFGDLMTSVPPRSPAASPVAAQAPGPTSATGDDIKDGIQVVSETERNVNRVVIDRLLANPTQFVRSVRVRPQRENGKIVGYALRRFMPNSPLELLGAKRGDVIRAVNGTELTSVDQALGAYQSLRSASDLTFSIIRDGKPMDLKINVR